MHAFLLHLVCFFYLLNITNCYGDINISILPTVGSFKEKGLLGGEIEVKLKKEVKKHQIISSMQLSIASRLFYNGDHDLNKIYAKAVGVLENEYGTLRLGPDVGAHYLIQADDFKNQNFSQSLNFLEMHIKGILNTDFFSPDLYIYMPGLWSDQLHLQNQMSDGSRIANKITYISSLKYNFVFALSFIPDTQEFIKIYNTSYINKNNSFKDIIQLAAVYRDQWNDLDFKFAIGVESGKARDFAKQLFCPTDNLLLPVQHQQGLKSWDISSEISYTGFKFGASYGNVYKSGQYQNNIKNGTYLNIGTSYSIAGLSISFTHFNSSNHNGDLEKNSLVIYYHLRKPIYLFTEISQIQLINKLSTDKFNYFLIGTKFNF